MEIFTTKSELASFLQIRAEGKTIGFVPTMGALHAGHLYLIETALKNSDVVVCSIFVNPTQFNNPEDLNKYPRPLVSDIEKLETVGCNILFVPDVTEMYNEDERWNIDLGVLESVLEGKYRRGHFRGVTQIVKKLFDVVNPDFAFFGQKDFQQFKVIEALVAKFQLPVRLVMCEIVRDNDGLALSSRNIHLSKPERAQALNLFAVLSRTKENFLLESLEQLKEEALKILNKIEGIQPEYFEICNSETLLPALSKDEPGLVALVAAFVGKTRLIDNLILK